MFKRFTQQARQVMDWAKYEAEGRDHEYIGTEHILLSMLLDGEGIAVTVLQNEGLSIEQIRREVERYIDMEAEHHLPSNINVLTNGPTFSPQAGNVLRYAVEEVQLMEHDYLGLEHILLGLLKEKKGIAAKVLTNLGVHVVQTREKILDEFREVTPQTKKRRKSLALDEASRDLTALAQAGMLDPVIGREREIERVVQILCRRTENNPVLIGEPGVGKTGIVEGLAQRIANRNVPQLLLGRRVVTLDLEALEAKGRYSGMVEARLKIIIQAIRDQGIILFIDDMNTIVSENTYASRTLKPALERVMHFDP